MTHTSDKLREEWIKMPFDIGLSNGQRVEVPPFLKEEIANWWLSKLETTLKDSEELAEALLDMYDQYCDDGHSFMSAGERASSTLERLGYAKFDEAGRLLHTDTNSENK